MCSLLDILFYRDIERDRDYYVSWKVIEEISLFRLRDCIFDRLSREEKYIHHMN